MPRRYFHRHWVKPRFRSLSHFTKYKKLYLDSHLQTKPADRDLAGFVSSHLSRPDLDLSSHLNRDLNYHLKLDLPPKTEHQLDISER